LLCSCLGSASMSFVLLVVLWKIPVNGLVIR
jgi:hypothetical protein